MLTNTLQFQFMLVISCVSISEKLFFIVWAKALLKIKMITVYCSVNTDEHAVFSFFSVCAVFSGRVCGVSVSPAATDE